MICYCQNPFSTLSNLKTNFNIYLIFLVFHTLFWIYHLFFSFLWIFDFPIYFFFAYSSNMWSIPIGFNQFFKNKFSMCWENRGVWIHCTKSCNNNLNKFTLSLEGRKLFFNKIFRIISVDDIHWSINQTLLLLHSIIFRCCISYNYRVISMSSEIINWNKNGTRYEKNNTHASNIPSEGQRQFIKRQFG